MRIFAEKRRMKIKELSSDDRPREKMLSRGAAALSNSELIAILIRTGAEGRNAVELGQHVMKRCGGSVAELSTLSIEELCQVGGIGTGKALCIMAAVELGRRFYADDGNITKTAITSPEMVYRLMLPHLKDIDHEECWALMLNRANFVISKERLSVGGMSMTVLDNKLVIAKALQKRASGMVLIHNHPSGNPKPGMEDFRMTDRLRAAATPFDISLVDHVIIAGDRYYSFSDDRVTIARK